jgi:hypothetical protein
MAHPDVLVQVHDACEAMVGLLNDNFPAVSRAKCSSVTMREAGAYLLHISSQHQCHHCYLALPDYMPGGLNTMANDTSQLWHLCDSQLLSYFNSHYPQTKPWQLCHL